MLLTNKPVDYTLSVCGCYVGGVGRRNGLLL